MSSSDVQRARERKNNEKQTANRSSNNSFISWFWEIAKPAIGAAITTIVTSLLGKFFGSK